MAKKKWHPRPGTTWRDKLQQDRPQHGTVVEARGQKLLIPRPRDVDSLIRKVRKGKVMTLGELRSRLARGTAAQSSCPLCTGIFLRIAAEAAEEDRCAGRSRITPWWRIVRDDGSLNVKLPGGGATQAARLKAEGVEVVRKRMSLG